MKNKYFLFLPRSVSTVTAKYAQAVPKNWVREYRDVRFSLPSRWTSSNENSLFRWVNIHYLLFSSLVSSIGQQLQLNKCWWYQRVVCGNLEMFTTHEPCAGPPVTWAIFSDKWTSLFSLIFSFGQQMQQIRLFWCKRIGYWNLEILATQDPHSGPPVSRAGFSSD